MAMWIKTAGLLLLGYLCLSRTFAYVGVPVWKAFIGEAVLVLFVVAGPGMGKMKWPWAAWRIPALRPCLTSYALFLGYGLVQVLRGIQAGNPALVALRDFAFNLYPVYFLLGIWAGATRPALLPKLLRGFAWFNGIYGMLYLLFLNRVEWYVPGVSSEIAAVPIFPQPVYSFVALLGLMVFERNIAKVWHLLILNGFVMLGMQFRTEWLAFSVGAITWLALTRQSKRVLQAGLAFVSLVTIMYFADVKLPGPEIRAGGEISVKSLVDRGTSVFHADLTDSNAAAGMGTAEAQEATFVWRTVWWLAIWNAVHENVRTSILGFGYGYPLGDLVPYLEGEFIRTPHNQLLYTLGYGGWVGTVLYLMLQWQVLRLLLAARQRTGDCFGVVFWAACMVFSLFFPLGETPYGAVPFYLTAGWVAAEQFAPRVQSAS